MTTIHKRIKIFNNLKTKKITLLKNDMTLLQENHSTKTTETKWQQEWNGMFFWNSGPTYHYAGVSILFRESFKGKYKIYSTITQAELLQLHLH